MVKAKGEPDETRLAPSELLRQLTNVVMGATPMPKTLTLDWSTLEAQARNAGAPIEYHLLVDTLLQDFAAWSIAVTAELAQAKKGAKTSGEGQHGEGVSSAVPQSAAMGSGLFEEEEGTGGVDPGSDLG